MKKHVMLVGHMLSAIKPGESAFIADDLDEGRTVKTSPVVAIKAVGGRNIIFETVNSVYNIFNWLQDTPVKVFDIIPKIWDGKRVRQFPHVPATERLLIEVADSGSISGSIVVYKRRDCLN